MGLLISLEKLNPNTCCRSIGLLKKKKMKFTQDWSLLKEMLIRHCFLLTSLMHLFFYFAFRYHPHIIIFFFSLFTFTSIVVFSAPIGQAYGLTETCAGGTFSDFDDTSVGRVGPPKPSTYVKVVIDLFHIHTF
jgi:hypothetical protein